MAIRLVSYNIQYGKGLDGRIDLERVAAAIEGADIACLQEVSTGMPQNGGLDMPAWIAARFPGFETAFHAAVDMGLPGGAMRFRFGNLTLSRWPMMSVRHMLLPRLRASGALNLQRGVTEALIAAPSGVLRVLNAHTDHVDPAERMAQVEALLAWAGGFATHGGAVTGLAEAGFPELPRPAGWLVAGDFNFEPGSAEHGAMLAAGLIDASAADPAPTWIDAEGVKPPERLDHWFATPDLAARVTSCRVDAEAVGSDHRPVWITLD